MNRISLLFLVLVVSLLLDSQSHAALVLQFGELNVVGDNAFQGSIGQTIVTQIYLTQTGSETRLSDAATGLAVADFRV